MFAKGYDKAPIPERYAHVIRCEKPIDPVKDREITPTLNRRGRCYDSALCDPSDAIW